MAKKASTEELTRYAVLWFDRGYVNTLIYRPEGYVRTYAEGQLDPRIGDGVPYADSLDMAVDLLTQGKKVAVRVDVAREIYGKDETYAPAGYGIYGG
jgi:hypothetical protein